MKTHTYRKTKHLSTVPCGNVKHDFGEGSCIVWRSLACNKFNGVLYYCNFHFHFNLKEYKPKMQCPSTQLGQG